MSESTTPVQTSENPVRAVTLIPEKKARRIRFRLSSLLVLIAVAAVWIAYVKIRIGREAAEDQVYEYYGTDLHNYKGGKS